MSTATDVLVARKKPAAFENAAVMAAIVDGNFSTPGNPVKAAQIKYRGITGNCFQNLVNPRYVDHAMLFFTDDTQTLTTTSWWPDITGASGKTRRSPGESVATADAFFAAIQVRV